MKHLIVHFTGGFVPCVLVAVAVLAMSPGGALADDDGGSNLYVLKGRLVLPTVAEPRTCNVVARRDALVMSIYTSSLPTAGDGDYTINHVLVEGAPMSPRDFPCSFGSRIVARDLLQGISENCAGTNAGKGPIPLSKGGTLAMEFAEDTSSPNEEVTIDVSFAVLSNGQPKLTGDCAPPSRDRRRDDDD